MRGFFGDRSVAQPHPSDKELVRSLYRCVLPPAWTGTENVIGPVAQVALRWKHRYLSISVAIKLHSATTDPPRQADQTVAAAIARPDVKSAIFRWPHVRERLGTALPWKQG